MPNPNTISPKQSAFAGFVARGDSYAEAYRKAYDAGNMSKQVLWNKSSQLAKNTKVRDAIESLKVNDKVAVEAHEKLSNDWIVEKLQGEAVNESNPPSSRIRALELLGKTGGLFDDSTHVTFEHREPEDIEKELLEKLGLLVSIDA
tara:strand:- start:86 stop:523 length:438 start_codon:yes stop_codon:yes gene_type:complete